MPFLTAKGYPYTSGLALTDVSGILNGTVNFSNLSLLGGLFAESATDNITALAGGGQAGATLLTSEVNRITTVASAGDSIMLPISQPGLTIMVINHGANKMQVYGNNIAGATDVIDDTAAATGVSHSAGSVVFYTCATQGKWYTEGLATGYFGSLQTFSSADGLSANSGGVQTGATPITAMMNRFSTVGGSGYSSLLPATTGLPVGSGLQITVTNAGANPMNVFPAGTDAINALGPSNAFSLVNTKTATFVCYTAGQWYTLPLSP